MKLCNDSNRREINVTRLLLNELITTTRHETLLHVESLS